MSLTEAFGKQKLDDTDISESCGIAYDKADKQKQEIFTDQQSQTDLTDVEGASGEGDVYNTDEAPDSESGGTMSTKNCVFRMLESIEERVQKLRANAVKIETERDNILVSLDMLQNSQLVHNLEGTDLDETIRYIKRLFHRSAAVTVELSTERNDSQLESLFKVNTMIDTMIKEMKNDTETAERRCMSYINSCSDSSDTMFQHQNCGIDGVFEQAVLGCTIEDQKQVKKRLNGLYSYFHSLKTGNGAHLSGIQEEYSCVKAERFGAETDNGSSLS